MKNKSQQSEQKRVDNVEKLIDQQLLDNKTKLNNAKKQTHQIEVAYGSNTRVNTFEIDDQMETNASVQQQKQLISMAIENETVLNNKQRQLNNLKGSPYFGRIDLIDNNQEKTFYIGLGTLQNNQNEFVVHDWRAPISSLYYNGTLGKVNLDLPGDNHLVNLTLKRQFKITNGVIKNMFDTNEVVGDEILQNVLGEKSNEYMKNIVSTIQQEQNTIIRDTSADVLIVQGVAGSGKTSTILQRIAYQLYHSRNQLNNDNMILFSPNKLFSNYISQVLPSLGEKNMRQVTLDDFLSRRLHGINVETLFQRFEKDINNFSSTAKTIRSYKESSSFFELIKSAFSKNKFEISFEDILFEGEIFFSKEEITSAFNSLNKKIPISQRYLTLKNHLIYQLKQRIKLDSSQEWVQDELDNLDDLSFQQLLKDNNIEDFDKQREFLSQKFLKERYRPIYNSIYNDFFFNPYKAYIDFLKKLIPSEVDPIAWQEMIAEITENIEYHKLRLSDAIYVLLIRDLVTGTGINYSIQSLFVDEMQDYPLSVYKYLHFIFPKAQFTLLGDFAQDIFSSTFDDSNRLTKLRDIFQHRKVKVINLYQSYRSSAPITNFSKAILPYGDKIQTFSRDGIKPTLYKFDSEADYLLKLKELYTSLSANNDTVTILTKSAKRANDLADMLAKICPVQLITDKNRSLKKGLLIMPIYLAKGLEFDAVIADNISKINYPSKSETDILYTIFTRAMHQLIITSIGEFSPIINQLPNNLYEEIKKD